MDVRAFMGQLEEMERTDVGVRTPKQWESTPGGRTSSLWSRLLCGYQLAVSLLTRVKKSRMCRYVHLGGEVGKESTAKGRPRHH